MSKPRFTIEDWIPEKFYNRGIHIENEEQLRYLGSKNLSWLSAYWAKKTEAAKKRARRAEVMYDLFYSAESTMRREKLFLSSDDKEAIHSQTLKFFETKLKYAYLAEDYQEAAGLLRMMAKRADDKPAIFTEIQYKEGENVMVFVQTETGGTYIQGVITIVVKDDEGKRHITVGLPEGVAASLQIPDILEFGEDETYRLIKLSSYHYFERDTNFFQLYLKAKNPYLSEQHPTTVTMKSMVQTIKAPTEED